MPDWLSVVLMIFAALLVIWALLIAVLWWQQKRMGNDVNWREIMRLVPDVIRLIKRLATDPSVPRGARWMLFGLLGYLLLPIDLVPDFIPVLGYADDAVAVILVLRFAIKHAGLETVTRLWPGTDAGLASLLALVGHGKKSPRT